ncbi:MAG: IS1634 family transposase [Bacteroidota bacterium]
MAAIVYHKCKKTGITYAYESISHWDKEKQQSRAKRKCIGKLDPETGEIIPTRKQKLSGLLEKSEKRIVPGQVPVTETARYFHGATHLFDNIGKQIGLTEDLKRCFPETYKQIQSIAYFLILEDNNPLSRFPKWSSLHKHPYGKDIPSQRSSELFAGITEESREYFFRLQGKRRAENEYWAYDTTSISSYSQCLKQVKYGVNKEHDVLPQINLALLFGEESNLPFYYRKLSGNIPDVKTVKNLLADISFLDYKKVKLVMDRGFYSESNINELYKNHLKFIVAGKNSLRFIQEELNNCREELRSWPNYSPLHKVYGKTVTTTWNYTQERPYKKDNIKGERRMYIHIYFNIEKAAEDEGRHNTLLATLQGEIMSGACKKEHEHLYVKFFDINTTPVRGIQITPKQDAMNEARKNFGYFSLISNEVKEPFEALRIYRNKDLVEKAFGNLKDRLNFRRTLVSSDLSLDGKLFVEFIALIYLSYIKKHMTDKKLFEKYTMQELLDEFDVIECFEQKGCEKRWGEITKKQAELFTALGVVSPSL